jgi:hypothetical protein
MDSPYGQYGIQFERTGTILTELSNLPELTLRSWGTRVDNINYSDEYQNDHSMSNTGHEKANTGHEEATDASIICRNVT